MMAVLPNEYAFSIERAREAADLRNRRQDYLAKFEQHVRQKEYTALDTPERLAARVNRLLSLLTSAGGDAQGEAVKLQESLGVGNETEGVTPAEVNDEVVERVIGKTRDFLFVEFLENALYVAKTVARVVTRLSGGRIAYATGFMVSPRLFLTNNHVFPDADTASASTLEFNYQRDRTGLELKRIPVSLDPKRFFATDKQLDFAVVAISKSDAARIADFRWCPLIGSIGKIVAGEPINLIQHPMGELKQIVIRENRLVDAFDGKEDVLQYEADTLPGSSGSPVFNDQWEVVALHSTGVPKVNAKGQVLSIDGNLWKKTDGAQRIDFVANQGTRVSKIVESIRAFTSTGADLELKDELLSVSDQPPSTDPSPDPSQPEKSSNSNERETIKQSSVQSDNTPSRVPHTPKKVYAMSEPGNQKIKITIPIEITVQIGQVISSAAGASDSSTIDDSTSVTPVVSNDGDGTKEKVIVNQDYSDREGYDPDFLGFNAPFPKLTNATRSDAFVLPGMTGDARYLVHYHRYSLIYNQTRKLAFVAGVNFDATAKVKHPRDKDGDKWYFDTRIDRQLQCGEDLYARNPLDRGHLVRRADAGWGKTAAEAKIANDDTFHFTNCSPQHEITNQGISGRAPEGLLLWGNLEDHVAEQGSAGKQRLSIFNGPVFRANDVWYRKIVKLPKSFWKVIVYKRKNGQPGAAAFVLSQAELIKGLKETFQAGEFKAAQVTIQSLEASTGLNFGKFREWDVMEHEEVTEAFTGDAPVILLSEPGDMVL